MVPHLDAAGNEVEVEGHYELEWLVKNQIYNGGMEILGDDGVPDGWFSTGLMSQDDTQKHSGDYSCKIEHDSITLPTTLVFTTEYIEITEKMRCFGMRVSGWFYVASGNDSGSNIILEHGEMLETSFIKSGEWSETTSPIQNGEWVKKSFTITPEEMADSINSTHLRLKIMIYASTGIWYIDDCKVHIYNPHKLMEFSDFSELNVEDYETFTFGQDYDLDDSGGIQLSGSVKSSDYPVQRLRMADASAERSQARDPIDIWQLVFILYSRAQQYQLHNWYKRTCGLSFLWLDEYRIEREVQFASAPEIVPRENNPEIAMATLVLESV
jgi:hypothetical protein